LTQARPYANFYQTQTKKEREKKKKGPEEGPIVRKFEGPRKMVGGQCERSPRGWEDFLDFRGKKGKEEASLRKCGVKKKEGKD